MIGLLKLPVYFTTVTQEDINQSELLGIDVKDDYRDGWLYVNPEHISSINEGTNKNTVIEVDGERIEVLVKFSEFIKNKIFNVIEL